MSFVLDKAVEGYDERLGLFETLPVETATEKIYEKTFHPVGQITKGATLEFDVQNNSSDYISLSGIYLLITLRILDDAGKAVKSTVNTNPHPVTFINYISSTCFRQVDVAIQHQVITSSVGSNFPYKVMLDTLLHTGKSEQESWLVMSGYEIDTAGSLDDCVPNDTTNSGLNKRYARSKTGKGVTYKTKLAVDILQQKKYLLPGVPINFKLYPASDLFCLMYGKQKGEAVSKSFSYDIMNAALIVPHVKVNPGLFIAHTDLLKSEMALYPFTRSEIKSYNVTKGAQSWSMDSIFQDCIPHRLVITLVLSQGYSGSNLKNPFELRHANVNYLDFQVDGQSNGNEVLQPNYTTGNYVNAYSKLLDSTPTNQKELPNISYYDFKRGYAIYVLDVNKRMEGDYTKPVRRGQTRLNIKFSTALTHDVSVIVYGTFDSLMKIDHSKNVYVEQ